MFLLGSGLGVEFLQLSLLLASAPLCLLRSGSPVLRFSTPVGIRVQPVLQRINAASRLSEDHVWHSRVKHIRVKYHYVREQVLSGEVKIQRVRSSDNVADILTKLLSRNDFQRLRFYLGLRLLET